jgi:putative tricarboxylic transport membrane protein
MAVGAVWLHGGLSLPQAATYAVVGPGVFPAAVGAGLVVLGALLLVQAARGERFEPQEAEDADPDRPPSRRALLLAAAGSAVPVALVRPLGFPVAAAVAFALVARAFGSTRLLHDLALGLALGAACWLLFARLLGLPLPGLPPGLPGLP